MLEVSLLVRASVVARLQKLSMPFEQGEPDAEDGAFAGAALEVDAPAVGAHDALHDHQAEAGALFFGGKERFENPVDLVLGNATAGVGHRDPDAAAVLACLE